MFPDVLFVLFTTLVLIVNTMKFGTNATTNLWDKVYPLTVIVPPMGGNGRLLR